MQRAATAYTLVEMRERVEQLDAFYRGLMQEGTDYGKIPGTDKPTLLQPGAQLACTYFGFSPTFEVLPSSVENWEAGFFALTVRCRLTRPDGSPVAEGIGACNSKEDRYRWRDQQPQCPACGLNALRKGAAKYGGGYYCAAKSGGCGANFKGDTIEAQEIARQPAGRIENPEPWSLHNTILKMAEKRALVAATLNATGASRIFTQDVEDLPEFSRRPVIETTADVRDAAILTGADPRPAPADQETRAKFEANWTKGTERAIRAGAVLPDMPPHTATKADLNKAQREFLQDIVAREKLNAEVIEKHAQVIASGQDIADVNPAEETDETLHEILSSLNEMLANAPDDEAF